MHIYEIEYDGNKIPNAFSDLLAFMDSNHKDYCLFKLNNPKSSNYLYIIFSEKHFDYFSPIFAQYEAKKLDKLPGGNKTPVGGNIKLLMRNE